MTPQAQLVLLLLLPFVLYLFKRFPPYRAMVISFILAYLFLPQRTNFSLPVLPDYNRSSATCYSIMLATCLYDSQIFKTFQFGWLDIPMLIWCICPMMSSITNDLGAYDGFLGVLTQTIEYGTPYFLGRLYLNDLKGLNELAMGIFIGGIVYAPLCILEGLISPQLHRMVYGYHGMPSFGQSYRLGGYRPNVFLKHGLAAGMWMMAAALIALWFWQSGTLKKFLNIPMNIWFIGLYIVHLLVRSTGAYLYMILGVVILFSAKFLRTSFPLLLLIMMLSSYLYLGVTGNFTGEKADKIVQTATNITGAERASSLKFRFDNEEILVEKAIERIWFGWGGWGRNRVYAYMESSGEMEDVSVTDSLWIIAYGINGAVGIIGVFGTSLLPALTFSLFRYPAKTWFRPQVAGAAAIAVITVLYVLDNLLNDMYNPVFVLASGALAGSLMNPNPQEFNPSVAVSTNRINSTPTENRKIPSQRIPVYAKPIPVYAKPNYGIPKLNRRKPRPIPIYDKPNYGIPKLNRRKNRPRPIQ